MKILSEKKIENEYQAYSNIVTILYYDSNSIATGIKQLKIIFE